MGLIELFEKNDTANPIMKAPIKLTSTVPKGILSKTLLNLRLMPQRNHAPSTEPSAIERREKYMRYALQIKVERIPTHSTVKESYVGIISQTWRFVEGGIPSPYMLVILYLFC